jgi:anti-sigma regulatory factor (Ser/Thr protein kinase)
MLDRYAAHVAGAECATVAFAVVEPGSESVSFASAGHPPPLLVTPDGHVRFLDESVSWPLGVQAHRARPSAHTAHLPAGSLLLLYTDGLVERRGESLDRGLERLAAVVGEHWHLPLRRVKQAIFGALVDERANDDIALVALRTVGATERVFADAFPADHRELPVSRRRLHAWLDDGVSEVNDGVLVAVGEAVANAIDHGSDDESQVVRVEAAVTDDAVVISVSDSGQWQPGIEGFFTGRGRGHLLMRAFADDVEIDTDQHGTIVTLTFARTQAPGIAVSS